MWFYIGVVCIASVILYLKKLPTFTEIWISIGHIFTVTRELFTIINRNGLKVCLLWTRQVIANQLGNRLVEMHHRYYIIHYPYGVTWYKIIVPRRRSPFMIDTIVDNEGNDVKKDVLSFMGPSHNFHGLKITPNMLGYKSLSFTYINGNIKTFDMNDDIVI